MKVRLTVKEDKPSNESLNATMFGCLILDRSTDSLLLFLFPESAYESVQELFHAFYKYDQYIL